MSNSALRGLLRIPAAVVCLVMVSCSAGVREPDDVVDRMIGAYGGSGNLPLLANYTGKGFMKQIPLGHVAISHPFDVYQKGMLYKTKTWRIENGIPVDLQVLAVNDTEQVRWSRSGGFAPAPAWEVDLLRYRFPLVLGLLDEGGLEGEMIESPENDGALRIRIARGDDLLTIIVDGKTWLLREMILESAEDSLFRFSEHYGDYREVDGIMFPNRFSATFRGLPYYEFLIPTIELGADLSDDLFTIMPEDTILPLPAPQPPGGEPAGSETGG